MNRTRPLRVALIFVAAAMLALLVWQIGDAFRQRFLLRRQRRLNEVYVHQIIPIGAGWGQTFQVDVEESKRAGNAVRCFTIQGGQQSFARAH